MSQTGIAILSISLGLASLVTQSQAQCIARQRGWSAERSLLDLLYQFGRNTSTQPDPRVYMALRLAHDHQPTIENQLFQRLVHSLLYRTHTGMALSLSEMALYTLSVKAACGNPRNVSSNRDSVNLLQGLDRRLQESMAHFNTVSFDNTETYEYILNSFPEERSKLLVNISLAMLALCLEEHVIPLYTVEMFVNEVLYYQYPYRRYFSFETNSYSILALSCLYHSISLYNTLRHKLFVAIQFCVQGLLQRLRHNGSFGGIVNTTLAIQAMGADILVHPLRYNCSKSLEHLINRTRTWHNSSITPEALALVIETLEGKTYLDIAGISCEGLSSVSGLRSTSPSPARINVGSTRSNPVSWYHNTRSTRTLSGTWHRNTAATRTPLGTGYHNTGLTRTPLGVRHRNTAVTRDPMGTRHRNTAATRIHMSSGFHNMGSTRTSMGTGHHNTHKTQAPVGSRFHNTGATHTPLGLRHHNTGTTRSATPETGHHNTGTTRSATPETGHHNTGTTRSTTPDTGHHNTVTTRSATPDTGHHNTVTTRSATPYTGHHNTGTARSATPYTGHHNTGTARSATLDTGHHNTVTTRSATPDTGHHNTGTARSATPDTGHHNTGTARSATPDTGTTRSMMSHQTVGSRLSLSTETGSIRPVRPSGSPRTRACCIPREQGALGSLMFSLLLDRVRICRDSLDPRIVLALRLSGKRSPAWEHSLQQCLLQSYSGKTLGDGTFTTGAMALYSLAFRASCIDPTNIPNNNLGINLIRLLDATVAIEMHALEKTKSYFTNASQVSLAILALCLENQEVSVNVAHYFVSFIVRFDAPEARNMTTGAKCSYVLALSCLLTSQRKLDILHSRIQVAMELLIRDLMENLQPDGSFGSVQDTGLVIQVLNAKLGPRLPLSMDVYNCTQSLQTLVQSIIEQTPPDTMDVVAALPALGGHSYLDIRQLCGSGESPCSEPDQQSPRLLNKTQAEGPAASIFNVDG